MVAKFRQWYFPDISQDVQLLSAVAMPAQISAQPQCRPQTALPLFRSDSLYVPAVGFKTFAPFAFHVLVKCLFCS